MSGFEICDTPIVEGDPSFGPLLGSNLSTAVKVPCGTTAQRPSGVQGQLRYNTDNREFEGYTGTKWCALEWDAPLVQPKLWSWGPNSSGCLGNGTTTPTCSPVREICSATDWCQVSRSAAIKTSGQLWLWGFGAFGQLGNGLTTNVSSPVREICSATDWCQVSRREHTAAIKTNGELWLWGWGTSGELGDGSKTNKCSPVREVCCSTDWCFVQVSNFNSTVALKKSGQLWSWGNNLNGNLGIGSSTNTCSPVREVCSAIDWRVASAAGPVTSAIKTNGQLWSWGKGDEGQLGNGKTLRSCSPVREICSATDWCSVSASTLHVVAIKTSGSLWGWGCNINGQLGDGTGLNNKCSPVREFCLSTEWCTVCNAGLSNFALKTTGQLWVWGCNGCGRLGDGTVVNKCSPVREVTCSDNWVRVGEYAAIACSNRAL